MSSSGSKGVFIAGTMQHHGKTTVSLGLVHALVNRGVGVAYQKPVGQQVCPPALRRVSWGEGEGEGGSSAVPHCPRDGRCACGRRWCCY